MKKPVRKQRDPWQHALTCPLPPQSSYQFLDALRQDVLAYLSWVTHDLVQGDLEAALHEIQRSADRLTRITAMTPRAFAAAADFDQSRFRASTDAERETEIQRLSTGKVDRSFDARIEAARLDDEPLSPEEQNVNPEDIPF